MKQIVVDLKYAFERHYKIVSEHIMMLGDYSYRDLMDDNVCVYNDDIHKRNAELIRILNTVDMCRKLDLNKEILERTKEANKFLEYYFTSTKENRCGFWNCKYKASKAIAKSKYKYNRLLKLK